MKQNITFITVVWGQSYIDNLLNIAFPSYLSPGNLPALAEQFHVDIVILTSSNDIDYFKKQKLIIDLSQKYNIKYIPIDDLITTNQYGVTLTCAYARGIMSYGQDMLNIHFLFMNSDFVIADDSLSSLIEPIKQGMPVIFAPSLRVDAENMLPILKENIADNQFSMSKREMVRHALSNIHPTVMAKTVNQSFCGMPNINQFYWQIDNNALLARFYLIFMMCIKPEKMLTGVNSYCDYGFVPEMCPSGNFLVLQDSDMFFMLELQEREAEKEYITHASNNVSTAAKSLSRWTTPIHRKIADYDIIFHSEELPTNIEDHYNNASAFISKITEKLSRPISHEHHIYWESGVYYWKELCKKNNKAANLPEQITDDKFSFTKFKNKIIAELAPKLIGRAPYYNRLNPNWIDHETINNTYKKYNSSNRRCLNIDAGYLQTNALLTLDNISIVSLESFISQKNDTASLIKEYDSILLFLYGDDIECIPELFKILSAIKDESIDVDIMLILFFKHTNSNNVLNDILMNINYYFIRHYCNIRIKYFGGVTKYVLTLILYKAIKIFQTSHFLIKALVIPVIAIVIVASYANNLLPHLNKKLSRFASIITIKI